MCMFPRYRLPVPVHAFRREHAKMGLGWSNKSQAFIFDKRQHGKLEYLMMFYDKYIDQLQEIPCGQCIACRIKASKELAQRALAESTMHESSWFVTLTYDDEHIFPTYKETVSRLTCEAGLFPCLVKRDFQLFAKNLRKTVSDRNESELVIFYCGEYGPLNGRPHFHAIIYGLQLHDLKLFKTEKGVSYFTSETISDAWKDFEHEGKNARPRGFHLVTEVNWETCAYVARYVTKKFIGNSEKQYQSLCEELSIEPQQREFHQGPKRPGLGLTWLQNNMEKTYSLDKVVLPGGKVMQPCSYYDKKFDIEYPGELEIIKLHRRDNALLSHMNEYKNVKDVEAYDRVKNERLERRLKRATVRSDF